VIVSPLALDLLRDDPAVPLSESLQRAKRLLSARAGVIRQVEFLEMGAEDPAVYWAYSLPGNVMGMMGQPAANRGMATSVDANRAAMKAMGESIERYCAALYDEDTLRLATYEELSEAATPPQDFALFSARQYEQPDFPFVPLTPTTPLRWAQGISLVHNRPTWVPAAFVYVPYIYDRPREQDYRKSISTGLACATNRAAGIYKGICEAIERDAFMIVWQNQLRRSHIDLGSVQDPYLRRLIEAMDGTMVRAHAIVLTLDIPVHVILVVFTSESDSIPYTVIGMGSDLSPRHALTLAFEEAYLGLTAMRRHAALPSTVYHPDPNFDNIADLDSHGLAHAVDPRLRPAVDFLLQPAEVIALDDLADSSSRSALGNVRTVVGDLAERGFDVISFDLTTPDIDEAGFKVMRTVVPGLHPLDDDHTHQHRGGRRLYDVPWRMGLTNQRTTEDELNPFPHPFP
jgi:ribosomal protein S12 methylthiotransferase accessory factor